MTLLIVSIILNIIPIIVLPMLYNNLPNDIPAYVDFLGNVMVSVEKNNLTILRLPLMGIIFSMVCFIMYTVKLPDIKQKYNKIIWSIVAFIGSIKMGVTSIEVCLYENLEYIKIFRILVFVLSGTGIITLLYDVIKIYKNKVKVVQYKNGLNKMKIIIVGILLLVYVLITIIPVYKYII
ncbi:MAG: hypothetical protein LBB80_08805 [Treponema sp.]|jgi:hypothetical protein|nr:hypothetical protein [Treponema sp.]